MRVRWWLAVLVGWHGVAWGTAPAPDGLQACLNDAVAAAPFVGVVALATPQAEAVLATGSVAGEGSAPLTARTRFNLGSAGKMFTAVAIGQLIDDGRVGLDDPLGRHVSGLTPETAAVTVRQALTHRGGLGNFFTPDALPALQSARRVDDLMPLVKGLRPAFEPGSRAQYANTGFLLLGKLIEQVSGMAYGEYLQQRVFGPAGMADTRLDPGPAETRAQGMTAMPPMGQAPDGRLRPAAEAVLWGNPAGSAYSTAADLRRFFSALRDGRLLSAARWSQFSAAQVDLVPARGDRPALQYGFGFAVDAQSGRRWVGHNGGTLGVFAEAFVDPEDGSSWVLLSPRDPPRGGPSLSTALRRCLAH